ncbi:hypothetical protein D3C74_253520 [compost metagenome]
MSVSDYNEITPHELNLHIKAYNEQLEYESKERITMAYLIAGWGRAKKMPDLYKILESTNRIPKDQTDEQLFKTIRQINAAMGGKEVKREAGE